MVAGSTTEFEILSFTLLDQDIQQLTQVAELAAKKAGQCLMQAIHAPKVVESLVGKDVKLQIDRDLEKIITDVLVSSSSYSVLGEETGLNEMGASENRLWWIVDPLDGTMNYYKGIPFFCISIALWDGLHPILGVIYDPLRDDLYTGVVGRGLLKNNQAQYVSSNQDVSQSILCTGFPVYSTSTVEESIQFVSSVRRFKKVRMFGSAAMSLAMVATGSAEVYQERSIALWDVAAGIALVVAGGGVFTMEATDSQKYRFNVSAANGHVNFC